MIKLKKTLLMVYLLASHLVINAQTFTVGSGGNYATLPAAVSAYNTMNLTQPVTFLLTDETYDLIAPLTLGRNTTANANRILTIKAAPGVNALISGTFDGTFVIRVAGNFITIDGSNNGTNSRNITIKNLSETGHRVVNISGTGTSALATNIVIKNLLISGGNNTGYALTLTDPANLTTACNCRNIRIENNRIERAQVGIFARGISTTIGTDIHIIGNDLSASDANAIRTTAIAVIGLPAGCVIEGNNIGNVVSSLQANYFGIQVSNGCSTVVVKNNKIFNIKYHYCPTKINSISSVILFSIGLQPKNIQFKFTG